MNENTKNALIRRNAEKLLLETMADTPVAVIQGARQTGKSTMIRMLSEKADIKYLTLDDPSILTVAAADPVAFVSQYPEGTL
ncbi:MAG: AAA family ATPase, partial [Clostridiales Family XIII bacterium]|nr:AAA family ATPase [Clostridiales Family XIII bacterium]